MDSNYIEKVEKLYRESKDKAKKIEGLYKTPLKEKTKSLMF